MQNNTLIRFFYQYGCLRQIPTNNPGEKAVVYTSNTAQSNGREKLTFHRTIQRMRKTRRYTAQSNGREKLAVTANRYKRTLETRYQANYSLSPALPLILSTVSSANAIL